MGKKDSRKGVRGEEEKNETRKKITQRGRER
jgi:hypothetical protein